MSGLKGSLTVTGLGRRCGGEWWGCLSRVTIEPGYNGFPLALIEAAWCGAIRCLLDRLLHLNQERSIRYG